MRIRRPHEPSPKPQWSLNKVLTLLENTVNFTETISLRKTAFLLILTTGWRISEVHVCVREEQYTSSNEKGSLLIKPHSSFLAKNGLRKRIELRRNKNPYRFKRTSKQNMSSTSYETISDNGRQT